jgi:hypothetical protein
VPLCLSLLEGTSNHFWYCLCGLDPGGPLCKRFEHAYQVNDLVRFFVDAIQAHLYADCDEWHAIGIGISRAEHKIDRSRSERRDAHSWLTSETVIDIGHERSGLLVTGKDEANGRSVKCIDHTDIFLSGYTKDVSDTLVFQTSHKKLCGINGELDAILSHKSLFTMFHEI